MNSHRLDIASRAVANWDDAQRAEYWESTARVYCVLSESYQTKAAALDAILASWGMTWEQYQRKGEANEPQK